MTPIEENIAWIRSGKIGCTFATLFARNPERVGWKFCEWPNPLPPDAYITSLVFPGKTADEVRQIALLSQVFEIEEVGEGLEGLRYKANEGVSWVQYFGPDSHVATRRTPHPMLTWTNRLPSHIYAKTMAKGILHLAHASIAGLTARAADKLWATSFIHTAKMLRKKPGLAEAAKTTWKKS